MKKIIKTIAFVLMLVLGSSIQNNSSAQYNTRGDISYQTFYDELSPYGRWMDYPEYGYVWIPDAGPGFQPYRTNGHWVWTDDYEWMWVSDYDWGWAPFHYGRWFEDSFYGWVWVPDYQWSPAWVAWRQGGDYYGWAPLRPGINISINFNIGGYNPPFSYWSFAPRRYITSPRIYDYCYDRGRNNIYINQTVIINNYNYNRNIYRTGPGLRDAERYTGRITPVRLRDSYTPGRTSFRNNQVSVYRPNVNRDNNRQLAPRQFDRFDRNNSDDRVGRSNNNGFRGNENGVARNNNSPNRNNNLPQREINRQDNRGRQPQTNNTPDRQRTMGDNNTRQPQVRNNQRPERQQPQQMEQRTPQQPRQIDRNGNGTVRQQPSQRFEQRNQERPPQMERNNNTPVRQQPSQRFEQRNQERPLQVERNNNSQRSQQPSQRFEQRNQERPSQMERNNNRPERQQPSQRVEQRRQDQPRQMERRQNNGQSDKGKRGRKDS